MKLYLIGHDCRYAMEQIILSLFPDHKPEFVEAPFEGDGVVSRLTRDDTGWTAEALITLDGKTVRAQDHSDGAALPEPLKRQLLRRSFYLAALELLPHAPAWGALQMRQIADEP